jgi:hypothetical protein
MVKMRRIRKFRAKTKIVPTAPGQILLLGGRMEDEPDAVDMAASQRGEGNLFQTMLL